WRSSSSSCRVRHPPGWPWPRRRCFFCSPGSPAASRAAAGSCSNLAPPAEHAQYAGHSSSADVSLAHRDKILILDFGSQVTQLIARRIRESGVYCEIHPFNMHADAVADFAPKGIVLSGGPSSVLDIGTPRAPQLVFELGVPVLGICYGEQTMCAQL